MRELLCLLGRPGTVFEGKFTSLNLRPKTWALLTELALTDGQISRRSLADLLFPEADNPRSALRWHLLDLRRQLPYGIASGLKATRNAISLNAPSDVQEFEQRVQDSIERPGSNSASVLALYRHDLCEGLTVSASLEFETWLFFEQERLRRRFRQATLSFARWARSAGQSETVIDPLTRLVIVDPYCEDAHVSLIEALEESGRPEAASEAFMHYERLLREDLQARPRAELASRYKALPGPGRPLPREGAVPLQEITLHVVEWPGPGPTIFAIHGSGGSAHSLAALAERLTQEARFVAPDMRGNGFSDKPRSGYTLQQHIEDLAEVAEAMSLDRPVLLGFSIGGAIASALATRLACRGLILLDGVVGTKAFMANAAAQIVRRSTEQSVIRFGGFGEYLARISALPPSDEAERLLKQRIRFDLAPFSDGTLRHRNLREALRETWASAVSTDTLALLERVRCPVLLIQAKRPWIEGRPYLSDEVIADQRRVSPQAGLYVAVDSNHPRLIIDPEQEMIEAIRRFVRACSPV